MRFLLTNDDGYDAPGLRVLAEVAAQFGETIVVAPERELSGCSHAVTVDRPMRVEEVRAGWFRLDGTPADCVRVAVRHLRLSFDWLVSGINAGGNLGADVFMSGTVAAAREAALFGHRAVAVSQYRRTREPIRWDETAERARRALVEVLGTLPESGVFWNVNLPDPPLVDGDRSIVAPPIVRCPLDLNPLAYEYEPTPDGLVYRGRYQERDRTPGADVERCFAGSITLTRIDLG